MTGTDIRIIRILKSARSFSHLLCLIIFSFSEALEKIEPSAKRHSSTSILGRDIAFAPIDAMQM